GRRAQRPSQRSARHNWNPSILGILTSDTTASTAWPARTSRAAAPLGAVTTSWPAWPSRAVSRRLRGGESSTTRTRIDFADLRPRRPLLAPAALVVLAAGLWLAWARTSTPAVRTVVARAATPAGGAGSVLDASGYVTARRQATVSAKITGKVTEVLIEEGMRVREGAVLARLDDTEAKAQLALARAQLGAARSQDGEIRAQLEQAERDYARSQEL